MRHPLALMASAIAIGWSSALAGAECFIEPVMTEEARASCRLAVEGGARQELYQVSYAGFDRHECGRLLATHGRELLAAIVEMRDEQITIEVGGRTEQAYGVPRPELVTAGTVCADLKLLGTTPASFEHVLASRRQRIEDSRGTQRADGWTFADTYKDLAGGTVNVFLSSNVPDVGNYKRARFRRQGGLAGENVEQVYYDCPQGAILATGLSRMRTDATTLDRMVASGELDREFTRSSYEQARCFGLGFYLKPQVLELVCGGTWQPRPDRSGFRCPN
jgi:hypothetical protein